MEAEDTITKTTVYNCHNTLEERLAEQAEIAFKAGHDTGYWEGRELGLRDGMREVVEQVTLIILQELNQNLNLYPWWQAKLKEWGVDE